MKNILLFLILILACQCRTNQKQVELSPVYIYDSKGIFNVYNNNNDSLDYLIFSTSKDIPKYIDTFLVAVNHKYYILEHYLKYNNYSDSIFVKHKSFLNNIKYFNGEWLENEEKLDSFWLPISCWRCGGIDDTTRIFLIEPVENTDSLIFSQVHRRYHQTQ